MAINSRNDPFMGFNFIVEIKGVTVGGFSEVTGLQVEVELQEYREGGLNEYIHKLAGPTRYPSNLILKHGITDKQELWAWHLDVRKGIFTRKNGAIILLNTSGTEVWRWNFVDAYPSRWSGPDLRANASEVAVETLELVHRGLSL